MSLRSGGTHSGFGSYLQTLAGFLPTRNRELEKAIRAAAEEAALSKRILFLSRSQKVFHLWHVVHKPFSYAFAVLVCYTSDCNLFLGISDSAHGNLHYLRHRRPHLPVLLDRLSEESEEGGSPRSRIGRKRQALFRGTKAQHPHIDSNYCIGCGTCTSVCPEGDVLAMIAGKAVIVNGHKCIGHGLCADACPVGAITMVMASPSMAADMPHLTPEYETTVPNLFIVGELGGLALIKNAVNQGRDCVDTIAARLKATRAAQIIPEFTMS